MSEATHWEVSRVVSGGQTGVDRGALDAAIEAGLAHGGWCPRGRLSEDGVIPARYDLLETDSAEYPVRTERNVLDSDGTLILYAKKLQGGTELTYRLARKHGKPHLRVDLMGDTDPAYVRQWLRQHRIEVLNVAGPRESSRPGIAELTRRWLKNVLRPAAG
jgi:hypothetical protein